VTTIKASEIPAGARRSQRRLMPLIKARKAVNFHDLRDEGINLRSLLTDP
jgi:hypothetical protein